MKPNSLKSCLALSMAFSPILLSAQESAEADSSDSLAVMILIVLIIAFAIVSGIYNFFRKRRCPHCKRRFCLVEVDRKSLGIVRTRQIKNPDGTYSNERDIKYQITKQCRHCGGQVTFTKVERAGI